MTLPYFQVSHSRQQGSRIRVLLNDVPLFSGKAPGYVSTQEIKNELVVPGENQFLIEMAQISWITGAFRLAAWREGAMDDRLVNFEWGGDGPAPVDFGKVPQLFKATFVADDVTRVPCFRRGDRVEFDCDGLPEQVDLVMRLQRALEMKLVDAWLELLALHHSEIYEANYQSSGDHPSTQRQTIADFFALPGSIRPLDPKELHFERRAEGRIAIVTRLDGGPPVDAVSDGEDALGFMVRLAPDIRMTRLDGRWQLF